MGRDAGDVDLGPSTQLQPVHGQAVDQDSAPVNAWSACASRNNPGHLLDLEEQRPLASAGI
jgi:hypothetical protein